MNRRSFVQLCVGAAAAGALAASTWSMARPLVIPRLGGSQKVTFFGAQRVAGPAPRGVPFIPIRLASNGTFEGIPTLELAAGEEENEIFDGLAFTKVGPAPAEGAEDTRPTAINFLEWYKYCGHQGAPGLNAADPDFAEQNQLKFFIAEEKIAAVNPWYVDLLEKPIKPADFPDFEFGAGFIWRSEGQEGPNVLTGAIVRYPKDAIRFVDVGTINPAKPLTQAQFDWVKKNLMVETEDSVFAAVSTFCSHFCCIPGYKEAEKLARARNAWDKLYCTCHNSVYEPREPVSYVFFPDPVKEGGEAAAAGGGH